MHKAGEIMKLFGKKIPKGNFLLYISFVAISLCFIMIISAIHSQKYTSMSQNDMYSGHEVTIMVYESWYDNLWENVITEMPDKYNNYSIYAPVVDSDSLLRGVYVKGRTVSPPLIWGKFFDENTSWSDQPMMVAGSSFENEIKDIGGKRVYTYNGVDYQVIGVIGTKNESRINNMMFIDFKSAIRENGVVSKYILDTKREKGINSIAGELERLISYKADCSVLMQGESDRGIAAELVSKGMIMDALYVMVLICFALCTVIVTDIWIMFRQQLFYSIKLCGYEGRFKALEIFRRYIAIAGSGYATGVVLMVIISAFVSHILVFLTDIIITFGLTIVLGIVILSIIYIAKCIKR